MIVVADPETLARDAAERLIARIAGGGSMPAICLTGGSSPKRLYALLATENYKARIPWDRVHWFIGDDRFVPIDDPLNNMGIARRLFLDKCAPPENIHAI
ncbi:MAG: 6-phosphogluconolactonase, partial [Hyphomicrobiales bacterium]|nr:6-phosphogluconolactonase [Hyphomicrobiales bacterium]